MLPEERASAALTSDRCAATAGEAEGGGASGTGRVTGFWAA